MIDLVYILLKSPLTPSHSNATRASGIDSSLKFLVCQCWPFLPERF